MPFALNEATEFINPTKALEYMATGKPIVSTAIEDVVRQFNDIVAICKTRAEFSAACQRQHTCQMKPPCKEVLSWPRITHGIR